MPDPLRLADPLALVTGAMAREVAAAHGVCGRPLIRRVLDRDTGTDTQVAIPCGSTRERACPSCAAKARRLRIQQCAEGWHRDTEPERSGGRRPDRDGGPTVGLLMTAVADENSSYATVTSRRIRSTRRRGDTPDLPRVPMEDRTRGPQLHRARRPRPTGRRCSSPSPCRPTGRCGRVRRSTRTPTTTAVPRSMRWCSRGWWTGSGRTCVGSPATGCSTSPPSNRSSGWPRICTPRSGARSRAR